jgi:hypothetical protein
MGRGGDPQRAVRLPGNEPGNLPIQVENIRLT